MPSTRNVPSGFVSTLAVRTHGSSLRELGAPLDQERAASMADEGGAAGAFTDALVQTRALKSDALVVGRTRTNLRKILPWALVVSGVVGGLAVAVLFWQRQR
jgi:hypothetical protein